MLCDQFDLRPQSSRDPDRQVQPLERFSSETATGFNGDQQTFPKLLQTAGYQTAIIGKWHLASTPQGYDYYDVLKGQGPYYNPPMITAGDNGQPVTRKHTGYTTEIITEKTLDWLQNGREKDKPFMVMFQHKAPHRDWKPAPKYLNWLDDVTLAEPETLWDDYTGRTPSASKQTMTVKTHLTPRDLKLTGYGNMNEEQKKVWDAAYKPKNEAFEKARPSMTEMEIIQWKYQRYVKDYLRCVKSVDDGIGEVLNYLDESGLAKKHGRDLFLRSRLVLGRTRVVRQTVDVRGIIENTLVGAMARRRESRIGEQRHRVESRLRRNVFSISPESMFPSDMQGRSLVPLLKGKTPADWRKTFYYHYYENPGAHNVARHYGVTDGQHKLIHYYALEGKKIDDWELFDLQSDPNELQSVFWQHRQDRRPDSIDDGTGAASQRIWRPRRHRTGFTKTKPQPAQRETQASKLIGLRRHQDQQFRGWYTKLIQSVL